MLDSIHEKFQHSTTFQSKVSGGHYDPPWGIGVWNRPWGIGLKQIDGVSMGSPLGPYLTNIFLSLYENTWLENFPRSFKPIYYCRYVDDCFLLFRSTEHVNLFLNFLNQQHANIKMYL